MQKDSASKYNSSTSENGNIVWMGTMCLAWRQLSSFCGVKSLYFDTEDPAALRIIDNFNNSSYDRHQIDDRSIYVKAGMGSATQNLINEEVLEKFPDYSFGPLDFDMDGGIISFAYLYKQLTFATKFERRIQGFAFNGKNVESFYAQGYDQKIQVAVHRYSDRENFMISIPGKESNDTLFFIKTDKNMTVDDAIEDVVKLQGKGYPMVSQDLFQMPIVEIECTNSYEKIKKLQFRYSRQNIFEIIEMKEALKLKVDESGAKMESMAVMYGLERCAVQRPEPRYFILDKTFWLVMKEKGKHPYLCMKIVEPVQSVQDKQEIKNCFAASIFDCFRPKGKKK